MNYPRRTFGIYALQEHDRPALERHLLQLDRHARRLRFGVALSDDAILDIARKLPLDNASFGLFIWGELKGCVQVISLGGPARAELAISLAPDMRGRGWGRALVETALERAQDQRRELVQIYYLRENEAMHRIASRLPGTSESDASEVCKTVAVTEVSAPQLRPRAPVAHIAA